MSFDFLFPDVGEGITEGKLVAWRVKKGDRVKADQAIADVETDKAVVEIPSPKAGIIEKLHCREGDMIIVGKPLATISGSQKASSGKGQGKNSKKESTSVIGSIPDRPRLITGQFPEKTAGAGREEKGKTPKAMPSVRKLAKDLGLSIDGMKGTGPEGRILKDDVIRSAGLAHGHRMKAYYPGWEDLEGAADDEITDGYGPIQKLPIAGIRKTIARHVSEASIKASMVTNHDEADITLLAEIREKEKAKAEKKGIKLTYLAYILKALAPCLKKFPLLNSSLKKGHIIQKRYINIGIAVDAGDALLVPVVKSVDKLSLYETAKQVAELAGIAKEKKILPEQMSGGSFTISNIGSIGGIYFTPILNYPQSAILGIGKVHDAARIIDGEIKARKVMPLSLTYDHRIIDGAMAARFLNMLISSLQKP